MARFRGTVQGKGGEASRLGHSGSGLLTTNHGWNQGVVVNAETTEADNDLHIIYSNGGSNHTNDHGAIAKILDGKLYLEANALLKCENLVQCLLELDARQAGFLQRLICAFTEPNGAIPKEL